MKIDKIDYFIIDCDYVDRLLNYLKEEKYKDNIHEAKVILAQDFYQRYIFDEEGENELSSFDSALFKNSIVGKAKKLNDVIRLINNLMEENHCGMFDWNNLFEMYYLEIEERKIIKFSFDTESG